MLQVQARLALSFRSVFPPTATGIAYYLTAIGSLFLTRSTAGIATLWPPSGILFAVLLITSKNRIGWHIAAAAIGSLCANLQTENALATSIGYTAVNMAESILAAWLVRSRNHSLVSFLEPGGLRGFCVAAVVATIVAATMAIGVVPTPSVAAWLSWFATDLLGILTITPLMLITHRIVQGRRIRPNREAVAETAAMLAMVTIVTGLTFAQSSYPLLFVPMLGVLAATFRLGAVGAAGGVLIVSVVSAIAISYGSGPQVLVAAGPLGRSLFMQLYLLALFASALPVAALLAARTRLTDQLAEKMRLLQLAEGAANIGHWRFDIEGRTLTWSPEVFRIHGLTGNLPPALDAAIEAYHVDDRALIYAQLDQAIRSNHGFAFKARIVRPNGEIRHVFSRGEIDSNAGDGPPGLFGIMQDITVQVAHETALQDARLDAEQAAEYATIMAETDQLTGIANRRRASAALEEAVLASKASGQPVAIAMFDIDHFKRINDTFGHQAGDEVLKRVADNASGELRSGDTLGRFGGEEFVIVLPNATANVGMMVAERVRIAIEAGGDNPRATISIGVAELADGETCETLLRRADQALYVAKREGRNVLRLAA